MSGSRASRTRRPPEGEPTCSAPRSRVCAHADGGGRFPVLWYDDSNDAASIARRFEDEYEAAFNRRDADALAALFLEHATIVTEWGDVVKGRAPFANGLARAFANLPGAVTLENTLTHAESVADDVVVSHGTSHRSGAAFAADDRLAFTRVLVRRNGEWRLAANHVSEPSVRPDPRERQRQL